MRIVIRRLVAVVGILAAIAGCVVLSPAAAPALQRQKPVRAALEEQYAKIAAAYQDSTPEVILELRLPDFAVLTPNGERWNAQQSAAYIRRSFQQVERTLDLSFTIKELDVRGDTAAALIHQQWSRLQRMGGQLRRVQTSACQRETWVDTKSGWRHLLIDSVQPLVWKVDGKRVDPSAPFDAEAPPYAPDVEVVSRCLVGPLSPPIDARSVAALIDTADISGLAIAVVSGDGRVWADGFGVTDARGSRPVNGHTVFEAASLSKPVVAYAALKLVDRGRLSLDRPLSEFLLHPELQADPRAARLTLRMILSHTTGLPNERIGNEPLAFQFDPGAKFSYSGEGFRYLGLVMEAITGSSFPNIVAQEVFNPLGMTRTGFVWNDAWTNNAAIGHNNYKDPSKPSRPSVAKPAASLHTTAHDYALFLAAMLKGEGLSGQLFQEMLRPQISITDSVSWGLGWSLERTPAGWMSWHHGDNSNSGFTAFAIWSRELNRALVYFANSTAGLGLAARVLELAGAPFATRHAAVEWMNRESYNSPARIARIRIEREIRERGASTGLRLFEQLRHEQPALIIGDDFLNGLGYRFVSLDRMSDALALFHANVQYFPASFNAYDSLGEAYTLVGNHEAALRNYERSVELNPKHTHGMRMIQELKAKLSGR